MSWTKKTVNGYLVGEGDNKAFAGSDAIVSDSIPEDIGGRKLLVGINITTTGSQQTTPFKVQVSHDETNWVDADTVESNIDLEETGVKMHEADLEANRAPWYRLVLEPGGAAGTTGRVKFIYTYKPRVIYAEA